MARIKITRFGGIAPSVDPRNLSDDGAQTALNLDLRFGDFRPTKGLGASVATVPVGTRSIFRTPSGVWLPSLNDTNWVNGQIADAASERVYLTGRSAYPEAWQGGAFRRLGVPAPTEKPTVVAVTTAQFDAAAATVAQAAAATAVVNSILAIDTATYLANPTPAPSAGATEYDVDYANVVLHLDFDALVSSQFVDKSPQARPTTRETGVGQVAGPTGPLGGNGIGYATLLGGATGGITFSEIRSGQGGTNNTWTVDCWVRSSVTREYLTLQSRGSNLREVSFNNPVDGAWGTLLASNYGGLFSEDLRCKRPSGESALSAGVAALVSVQCTGTATEVYIDGVLCGSVPYALALELSTVGRSTWTNTRAFVGQLDDLRVTLVPRYAAGFTPPAFAYPTSAVPAGAYVAHGAVTGLPTDTDSDGAYLVRLTASGGGFVTVSPPDELFRDVPFVGSQVTFAATPHWAVLLKGYRAAALAATQGNISTAIAAVANPAGGGALLTAPQVATLAPLLATVYDPTKGALVDLVTSANIAQADLRTALAATPLLASTIAAKVAALTAATGLIVSYFNTIDIKLRTVLAANESTMFGAIQSQVVSRDVQTRTYIVTYLSDWDEESAPSPAADLLSVDQNDLITVTTPPAPASRNIVGWRLYRSAMSSTGASWALVADTAASNAIVRDGVFFGFLIGNRSYTDGLADEMLQEPCATITWAEPPANLRGLVGMPNGIMAGFFGKTLCFSEPFAPYAWPVEYQLTIEHNIVGTGVFGQTAVVLTEGFPYYVSGADAASMSAQKIEAPQACLAAGSITSVDGGVMYVSPDGLCLATASGVAVQTQMVFSKDDWKAAVPRDSIGVFQDGRYFLFEGRSAQRDPYFRVNRNRVGDRLFDLGLPRDPGYFGVNVHRIGDRLYSPPP